MLHRTAATCHIVQVCMAHTAVCEWEGTEEGEKYSTLGFPGRIVEDIKGVID